MHSDTFCAGKSPVPSHQTENDITLPVVTSHLERTKDIECGILLRNLGKFEENFIVWCFSVIILFMTFMQPQ